MPSARQPTSLPDFLGPAELLLGLRSPWALGGVCFLCGYPPDFSVPRSPDFGQPWWGGRLGGFSPGGIDRQLQMQCRLII